MRTVPNAVEIIRSNRINACLLDHVVEIIRSNKINTCLLDLGVVLQQPKVRKKSKKIGSLIF